MSLAATVMVATSLVAGVPSGGGGGAASPAAAVVPVAPRAAGGQLTSTVLDGPWFFRQAYGTGGGDWMPATVPGCVHTDLLANHRIPDPFVGTHEKDVQWVENADWEYRTTVFASDELLASDRVELVWQGLDTFAEVFVGGVSVLTTDNMFRRYRVDVKAQLHPGDNTILVHFRSPIAAVKPAYDRLGYRLPAANDQAEQKVSMFARKAPYQYGWDWGPRLVTAGIWRPVSLQAWDGARIDDVHVVQDHLDDAVANLTVNVSVLAVRAEQSRLMLSLDGTLAARVEVALQPGPNQVAIKLAVGQPRRWWPSGLGAANLYKLGVVLVGPSGVRDQRLVRVGLRTVEVVSRRDKQGKSFTVKVNGAPLFMKGANYIPPDSFLSRVTPQRRRALVQAAADANMNMLRVWGGGVYEDDDFYDQCDQLGILVWQDFMFACSMYPGDPAFVDNVRHEATDVVRRLRNHPSLALWAGNNEIEVAWAEWGWPWSFHLDKAAQATISADYRRLFHQVLPEIVGREDPGRFYTPSSPSANEDGVAANKMGWGDRHEWGVWHGKDPYTKYADNVSRFMSEYGFQSFPELATVAAYAAPAEQQIESPVMRAHQRHPQGNELIATYLARDFRAPKSFDWFLYVSQVLQATVIKFGAEAHRRRMPYNAGSLYWQLDDCWPVASWSSVDYFGRWKALHHYARRFFAPLLVSPALEKGTVRIYVVSDKRTDTPARLTLRLLDFEGRELWRRASDVKITANSSRVYQSLSKRDALKGADPTKVVLVAELSHGSERLGRNLFFFVKTRDLDLPPPELSTSVELHDGAPVVRVSARRMARDVRLTAANPDGAFADNFFDLLPGESATVPWRAPEGAAPVDAPTFARGLHAASLRDSY